MVRFTDDSFVRKVEKLIDKLQTEEGFYLVHLADDQEMRTIFGNGYLVFDVPGEIGKEKCAVTGASVSRMLHDRFWGEEAMKAMRWVPLPKESDLKVGHDKKNPVKCNLAATDMEQFRENDGVCATYPFAVQARYLKMALQLAKFSGSKDTYSVYNPLCLWAQDDAGDEVRGVIMPIRE